MIILPNNADIDRRVDAEACGAGGGAAHLNHDTFALQLRHDGGQVGVGVNVEVEAPAFAAHDDQVGHGVSLSLAASRNEAPQNLHLSEAPYS